MKMQLFESQQAASSSNFCNAGMPDHRQRYPGLFLNILTLTSLAPGQLHPPLRTGNHCGSRIKENFDVLGSSWGQPLAVSQSQTSFWAKKTMVMGVGPPGEPGNTVSAVQLHLQLSSLAQNKTSFEMDLASWATWPHGPPWLGSRWGQMSVHNHLEMMNLADFSMKSYEIYQCSGVKTFVTFNDIWCFIGQLAQKKKGKDTQCI